MYILMIISIFLLSIISERDKQYKKIIIYQLHSSYKRIVHKYFRRITFNGTKITL